MLNKFTHIASMRSLASCYNLLRLMESFLESSLITFIKENVKTFLTWDLLVYFYKNPNKVETDYSLSAQLGRSISDVARVCEELAEKGILVKNPYGYCFTQNEKLKEQVKEFVVAQESREKRLLMLTYLLKQDNE